MFLQRLFRDYLSGQPSRTWTIYDEERRFNNSLVLLVRCRESPRRAEHQGAAEQQGKSDRFHMFSVAIDVVCTTTRTPRVRYGYARPVMPVRRHCARAAGDVSSENPGATILEVPRSEIVNDPR
jgi:hypothetical protein